MAVAAALALAGSALPGGAFASSAPLTTKLPCHASMSNANPEDYSTTDVDVTTVARAHVKAVIAFHISDATPGRKVPVDVTVTSGKKSGSCSTSFKPKR